MAQYLNTLFDLQFNKFSICFELDTQHSIEDTLGYLNSNYPAFVFARGKALFKDRRVALQIFDYLDNGNLLESLKTLENRINLPPKIRGLEEIIECGQLGLWKQFFWERLRSDSSLLADGEQFDLLNTALGNTGATGEWNIYLYNDSPVFEVSIFANGSSQIAPFYAWSQFDPHALTSKIKEIRKNIAKTIRIRMNLD